MKDGGESPRPFLDLETGQGIGWPGEKVSRGRLPSRTDPCLSKKPRPPSAPPAPVAGNARSLSGGGQTQPPHRLRAASAFPFPSLSQLAVIKKVPIFCHRTEDTSYGEKTLLNLHKSKPALEGIRNEK